MKKVLKIIVNYNHRFIIKTPIHQKKSKNKSPQVSFPLNVNFQSFPLHLITSLMKPNKYTLLDKTEPVYKDHEPNNKQSYLQKNDREVPYSRLEDDYEQKQPKNMKTSQAPSVKPKSQVNASRIPHQGMVQVKPITYDLSNCKNSVVHIGPSGIMVQPNAPYIPPVLIDCQKCKAKQHIPGNAHEYICYACHQKSNTDPKFGLFVCGVCHNHVCYQYRTSDHIQCNFCFMVNKVPLEPGNSLKSKKMEQILPKDLREEEVILQQNVDFPDLTTVQGEAQQRETLE